MKMKCGCEPSWNQLDFDGNEQPYCSKHDTYEMKDDNENSEQYNDCPILSGEEYDVLNQKYVKNTK